MEAQALEMGITDIQDTAWGAETENNSVMSARELLSKRQLNCWSYLLPNREISVQVI